VVILLTLELDMAVILTTVELDMAVILPTVELDLVVLVMVLHHTNHRTVHQLVMLAVT